MTPMRRYPAGARRVLVPAVGGLLCGSLTLLLVVTPALGREAREVELGQRSRRPDPETYHWVLPAQHSGVEVADLHPNDCYAIERAEGLVYFGTPPPDVLEWQRQLGEPHAHLVDGRYGSVGPSAVDEHPECALGGCLEMSRLRSVITARLQQLGDRQYRRLVGHRPTPIDGMRGGAYSDVGSDDRPRYRQAPEQRMVYLHLGTAARGNCYEAKVPRTLTIHIRDHQQRTDRTGVYTGYLYVEHHHPGSPGHLATSHTWGPSRQPFELAESRATDKQPGAAGPRLVALSPPLSRREREGVERSFH